MKCMEAKELTGNPEVMTKDHLPQPALQDVFLYSLNCRFSNPKTILPFIAERVIYLATRYIKINREF